MKYEEKAILSLKKLIDYTLENEEKHWQECEEPAGHIYQHAIIVREWLIRQEANRDIKTKAYNEGFRDGYRDAVNDADNGGDFNRNL